MAMSPRTKMKRYRERMSEEKKAEMRGKNRDQQSKSRSKWSPRRKKQEQAKNTIIQRKLRIKKKEEPRAVESAFKTRQAAGKAIKKAAQALPSTPRRKSEVILKLAQENSVFIQPKCKRTLNFPDLKMEQLVTNFYEQDDISRQLPGKKDYVTVMEKGVKTQKQKKILLMNVSEAYQLFKQDHPSIKVGKSKFASLRPKHVCICSDRDHSVCCCIYHENFSFLLDSMKKMNRDIATEAELLEASVCPSEQTKECFLGDCPVCCDVEEVAQKFVMEKLSKEATFQHYQWNKDSEKELCQTTFEETKHLLTKQLAQMRRHNFIAKHQHAELKKLKESLGEHEAILHVDFAENFNIKQQKEIMSAHFKQSEKYQVTIYTAIAYMPNNKMSFAIISDCLRHDKYSVAAFNQKLLTEAKKCMPGLKTLHVFSDGAAGQFKNRFTLSLLTEPDSIEDMDWSFFATAHGKGPIDGIGGTVKRVVWRRILREQAVINSAKEFAEVASTACPCINILFVSNEEVQAVMKELDEVWSEKAPKTIPNTRKYHFFKAIIASYGSPSAIKASDITCFELHKQSQQEEMLDAEMSDSDPSERQDTDNDMRWNSNGEENLEATAMSQYIALLKAKGLQLNGITPSDGNCFFWAVSKQISSLEMDLTIKELRKRSIDFLKNMTAREKEELGEFITLGSFKEYITNMEKNGSYADHIMVEAMSKMLKVSIQIIMSTGDVIIGPGFDKKIQLGYIPELQHYIAIKPKEDEVDPNAPVDIEVEHYYAVDYVDRFYIGRVLADEGNGFWKVKFLHQQSTDGILHFLWPERDDVDKVHSSCIFWGPVFLEGCLDFTVKNIEDIEAVFRARKLNIC